MLTGAIDMATLPGTDVGANARRAWSLLHDDGQVEFAIGVYFIADIARAYVGMRPSTLMTAAAVLAGAVAGLLLQRFVVRPRRGYVSFRRIERARYGLLAAGMILWFGLLSALDIVREQGSSDLFGLTVLTAAHSPGMVGLLKGVLPLALLAACFGLPRLFYLAAAWGLILFGLVASAQYLVLQPVDPFSDFLFIFGPGPFAMPFAVFIISAHVVLVVGVLVYGSVKLLHLVAHRTAIFP